MKKLTAGIFTVLMGLVSVNAADAAVASKGYVDKLNREQGALVEANTQNITKNAGDIATNTANIATNTANITKNAGDIAQNTGKIGGATFTGANYVSGATNLTAAVAALDTAVKNVASGSLELDKDAVNSNIIKDGEVATVDIADSAVTEAKIADKAVTANKLSDALSTTISGKADKATTLSGYGITDAYTKTEADAKLGEYATDDDLNAVSAVANANKDAITVLNGDENTVGSVAEKIKTADTATLNSAKAYTDGQIEALDLQAISRVPAECGNATNYCVLTTNGANFVWEVIVRENTTLDQGDDGLYGEYPATEPAVTQ